MSIFLSRLRDTRIEEDSENSTFSKDLLVRNVFEGSYGRQAFSVVGIIKHGSPLRGKGSASHTKTLMETTSRRNQLSPLPKIGEGFGEWSEALLRRRRVGWLWPAGLALQLCFLSVTKENEVIGMVFAKLFVYLQSERKKLVFYDESIFAKSIGNTGFFTWRSR